MTFQDIFKSKFLENVSGVSLLDMALGIILAFLLGLFIFWIYKKTYIGVMYSSSFYTGIGIFYEFRYKNWFDIFFYIPLMHNSISKT